MTPQRSDVPLRVGIVGAGLIGRRRALVAHHDPRTIPVVVADSDHGRAEAVAQEVGCQAVSDWHEVITRDDIEVIVVSTTNDVLAPVSLAAMQHGKHVLCEKPPGRTVEDARQMMEMAREQGVLLKIGFNHRYHTGIAQAKRYCTQGDLGDLYVMRCVYGHGGRPGYEQEWRAQRDIAGGGELLDQGSQDYLFPRRGALGNRRSGQASKNPLLLMGDGGEKPARVRKVEQPGLTNVRVSDFVGRSLPGELFVWRRRRRNISTMPLEVSGIGDV